MKTFLTLSWLFFIFAIGQPAAGQSTIGVDLDHATFAYDDEHSLVELYLAFSAPTLPYEAVEQGFKADLMAEMVLTRSTEVLPDGMPNDPVWQDTLNLGFVIPDTTGLAEGQHFLHQVRLPVQPGEYELYLKLPGNAAQNIQSLTLRRDLLVPDFSKASQVSLSDITLATSITPGQDRTDIFYKNGLIIRPNANQLFGHTLATLYFYVEVYHAQEAFSNSGEYTLLAYLAEANRPQPLPDMMKRMIREARSPDVYAGTFDLASLPSGSYFLRLAVLNADNESVIEQSRKFFVYNPLIEQETPLVVTTTFEASPYATMTEDEVEKGIQHANLIASDREMRQAKSIQDLDERRRFLMDFWQKRDPQLSTPINEFKDDFYARLQYVNERYGNSRQEGWKTDRGRVYVKYGSPAQIEPHLYERDSHPYELWTFNNIPGEGQALFVFADTNGFGEFRLLHSSVAGEPKQADWVVELRK